ncbi:sulfite exporter TauE/SafE family protein [Halorussus ruber]|uniref:sulfite exporter TauE/SafE family protein n=1 Tax=Halorussus ruber TaxID=1126238 RepID=UPI001092AE86|nr:sulfite exporter TauE/SafE family protein [Halorussus ruber]
MSTTTTTEEFLGNLTDFEYREVLMTGATAAVVFGALALFPGVENVSKGIDGNLTTWQLALFVLLPVAAGAIKGTIGFGYALVTTPIFATVIDPTMAVVVLAIPPWMINVFQVGETDTGAAYVRERWSLLLLALVGSILGVFFLDTFSTHPVVPFLIGLLILGYVVFEVVKSFVTVEKAHNPLALGGVGLLEGFLLAAANLGPLLPAYLHTFERDTDKYVGGLSMVFTFVFTARIVQMALFTDLLTTYRLWLGCALAVVTAVGLLVGTYLRRTGVDEDRFNWLVVGLLFVISLNIFYKTGPVVLESVRDVFAVILS